MERVFSFIGLFTIVGFCWSISESRRHIKWKTVTFGILLQLALGVLILKTKIGWQFFEGIKELFSSMLRYSGMGSKFVFGSLSDPANVGFVFFTMILPVIVFVSSLMGILYHLGIMQMIIKGFARLMMRLMDVSGAESLAAAANIFIGQTEAYLVIRPLLPKLTRSELLALMTGGMATVAGAVLATYIKMGIDAVHLLAASVMSAPAALVCAKLLIPETKKAVTRGTVDISVEKTSVNVIDAATTGAAEGMKMAINVGAMLIAFISLIALVNGLLSGLGSFVGLPQLTLEWITGYLFAPVAFLLGVPWAESTAVGSLLAKKLILNEFVAYLDLQKMKEVLSPRSVIISTYALCGFANFGSVGIQLGAMRSLVPERQKDMATLGIRSLIAGTMACLMTACVAGIFV